MYELVKSYINKKYLFIVQTSQLIGIAPISVIGIVATQLKQCTYHLIDILFIRN